MRPDHKRVKFHFRAGKNLFWPVLSLLTIGLLGGQDSDRKDLYLPDLGIIIEDSSAAKPGADPESEVNLKVRKGIAGAAYVESTQELRTALEELSAKITELEHSLDNDVDAVHLENERLRSMLRKLQSAESQPTDASTDQPAESDLSQASDDEAAEVGASSSQDILKAYLAGNFDGVVSLCREQEDNDLNPELQIQIGYWCANSLFRTGRFDEALLALESLLQS
ncbi:MAG: hypothetical protein KAU50_08130, partial [Candidatus Marinimicrobia bacterium]|nr:hypothetical protein [Candidatus Neomarinimicrobiota bacterium]